MFTEGLRHRSARVIVLAVAVSGGLLAGCSSSSSSAKASHPPVTSPAASASSAAPSASASTSLQPLTVVVTNDDGVHAPGIDVLVQALRKEPGLTVKVVAPATNQSGVGGKATAGTVKYSNTTTLSGYPAVAVAGTPSDAVSVAITQLKLNPGLVMSGINAGQNLGPVVNISGTVGAAREAARHGVPALAVSSGFAPKYDFATAVTYALNWLHGERPKLPQPANSGAGTVAVLNVPTCATGKVRGELQLPQQVKLSPGEAPLGKSDCTSTAKPTTEVAAFTDGFATLVAVPVDPS